MRSMLLERARQCDPMDDKQFALYEALAASHSLSDEWEAAACAFYECHLRLGRVLAMFGRSRPSHELYISLLSRQLRSLLGALNALALHENSSNDAHSLSSTDEAGGLLQPFLLFRRVDIGDVLHPSAAAASVGNSGRMDTDAADGDEGQPATVKPSDTPNENAFELISRAHIENQKALVSAKLFLEEFCYKDTREALGIMICCMTML